MQRKHNLRERDEKGQRLRARVSTKIWADNYNWVNRNGGDFSSILDATIQQMRLERIAKYGERAVEDPVSLQMKEWSGAFFRKNGRSPNLEEFNAKRKEFGLPLDTVG